MAIGEVRFTHPFKTAVGPERQQTYEDMMRKALVYFPELKGDCVNVGLTRAFGVAAFAITSDRSKITIRFNPSAKLSYHLIGHELTHFVQRQVTFADDRPGHMIPSGEKQSDIWTLARHPLFCDAPPAYLKIPQVVKDDWDKYSSAVGLLCEAAITERWYGLQNYIVWLEAQLGLLCEETIAKQRYECRSYIVWLEAQLRGSV